MLESLEKSLEKLDALKIGLELGKNVKLKAIDFVPIVGLITYGKRLDKTINEFIEENKPECPDKVRDGFRNAIMSDQFIHGLYQVVTGCPVVFATLYAAVYAIAK
jgi:hypothetical protein